ncbi:proline-rich proteoglycan 2-like [Penaeus monodon]|uniref:proline-rich proteoglycan 2-like n=1 Tax=Penaeus monodon TaxID=6687 RepID=UPI0018A79439|nr:proline-rich proteoglycan 2-like [Penaeus monodon]
MGLFDEEVMPFLLTAKVTPTGTPPPAQPWAKPPKRPEPEQAKPGSPVLEQAALYWGKVRKGKRNTTNSEVGKPKNSPKVRVPKALPFPVAPMGIMPSAPKSFAEKRGLSPWSRTQIPCPGNTPIPTPPGGKVESFPLSSPGGGPPQAGTMGTGCGGAIKKPTCLRFPPKIAF